MSAPTTIRVVLVGTEDATVIREMTNIIKGCGLNLQENGHVEIVVTNDENTARNHLRQEKTQVAFLITNLNDDLKENRLVAYTLSNEYPTRVCICEAPKFREMMSYRFPRRAN